jgi:hypothetical protein
LFKNSFDPVAMGFYLRKSVRVGPLRFNLSKSGIGVSVGIKGFRVGSGPRGNYVHMGANGVYYRKTLAGRRNGSRHERGGEPPPLPTHDNTRTGPPIPMRQIDSADVSQMVHSSSVDLLQEINDKRKLVRLGPVTTVFGAGVFGYLIFLHLHPVLLLVGACFTGAGVFLAWWRDALHKTVVLLYDFDPPLEHAYSLLHYHAMSLAACRGIWHLAAIGQVQDRKYHSGASQVVDRKPTSIRKARPS